MYLLCPQLENVIQKSIRPEIPSHVVHNQTAAMLEIGTNLLTHTAEQTRKLNVVEAKVASCRFAESRHPRADFLDLMCRLPPGAEPNVADRDPASGELSVYQQAGEGAAAADV